MNKTLKGSWHFFLNRTSIHTAVKLIHEGNSFLKCPIYDQLLPTSSDLCKYTALRQVGAWSWAPEGTTQQCSENPCIVFHTPATLHMMLLFSLSLPRSLCALLRLPGYLYLAAHAVRGQINIYFMCCLTEQQAAVVWRPVDARRPMRFGGGAGVRGSGWAEQHTIQ